MTGIPPVGTAVVLALALALALAGPAPAGDVQLDPLAADRARVHDMLTLRGQGFGAFDPAVCSVVFTGGGTTVSGGTPYVWRDDCIMLRVPVGDHVDGSAVPIPKTPLDVHVVSTGGTSNTQPFQVITVSTPTLAFFEQTRIEKDVDVSAFLGSPNLNIARTKDADVGDANGDGFPDLVDNNSNNETNGTHGVLRLNDGGGGFDAIALEPLSPGDEGDFATTVPPGGDYVTDSTTYDADFADLNNDGLPELIQSASPSPDARRLRILANNHLGVPGQFVEDTATWISNPALPGCPDDVAHGDLNHDGWVDVATSLRTINPGCGGPTSEVLIYLNQLGQTFIEPPISLTAPFGVSTHDVFLFDADADGNSDVLMLNESGSVCELYRNQGGTNPSFDLSASIPMTARAGDPADFDGDGLIDFCLAGGSGASVFLNDPDDPGTFTAVPLPNAPSILYDMEPGDLDLDGDVDIVGATISFSNDQAVRVWLNDGTGVFTDATAPDPVDLLPGLGEYQRLSADLIDYDLDGDLDLYLTGADGQDVGQGFGFGRVPNQFYENRAFCPADIDGDLTVGVADLTAVILAWGPTAPCPPMAAEDVDRDCDVGVNDLVVVITSWGVCP